MAPYKIFFKKSVEKDLKSIPKRDLIKILRTIQSLGADPRPRGSEKLTDQERYRVRQRVRQGAYRIVYSLQDAELTIWVVTVGHRKEVYTKIS